MAIADFANSKPGRRMAALLLVLMAGSSLMAPVGASAEERACLFCAKKQAQQKQQPQATQFTTPQGGKAVTATEIVNGSVSPFIATNSAAQLTSALDRYTAIQSQGGWPQVGAIGKMKKGSEGKGIAGLNQRLFIEGYVRKEAAEGEFASIFTSATEDAVKRFQRNHGLAVTGAVDTATLKELNVPVEKRIATIRANIPRLEEYAKNLGDRYIVVNIPALQLETVNAGKVYSIHNVIVGRPSRPTPVVQTALATIKFSPFWNAPTSIVEKDIIPRMLSGGPSKVLRGMNMKVFQGVGGPEVDPDTVDWRTADASQYHFRQDPGGENAMKSVKIEFPSPFGIYMHDTPEPQLFKGSYRFFSSGCIRIEKVAIVLNWILRGQDGIDEARIAELAKTEERLDVKIVNPPQLRVAYLTAWSNSNGEVNFRNDIYELDGSGFVVGQPLDVAESGQRFVLNPAEHSAADVDAAEVSGSGFSLFRFTSSKTAAVSKPGATMKSGDLGLGITSSATSKVAAKSKTSTKSFFMSSAEQAEAKQQAEKGAAAARKLVGKDAKATGAKSKTAVKSTKAVDPKATGKKPAATTGKDTAKTPADCKPDKDGKLPDGCKSAAVAKPKTVTEAKAEETPPASN